MVTTTFCSPEGLQEAIQKFKDAGRRILAVSPSKLKKVSVRSTEFQVIEFVVVAQ